MHILTENFGNFELEAGAVGMRSVSETDIKLPYTGVLPDQMADSDAYVYLNVQLVQGTRLVLVTHRKGKDVKRPLAASNEEIIALLDRFFEQSQDATGVAQYWLGLWHGHYIEWKKVVTRPEWLLNIFFAMSAKDRELLQKQMMDMPLAET